MPYIELDPAAAVEAPELDIGVPLTGTDALTLEEFQDELDKLLGSRGDVKPERLQLWINLAYLDIAASIDLEELKKNYSFMVVVGSVLYKMPDQFRSVIGISAQDSQQLLGRPRPLDKIEYETYTALPERSGVPTAFFMEEGLLGLWPTPEDVVQLNVKGRFKPLRMWEAEHQTILGNDFDYPLLMSARAIGFDALFETEKAAMSENRYLQVIRRKLDEGALKEERRIPGSMGTRGLVHHSRRLTGE